MTVRNKTFYAMVFLGSVLVVAVDICTIISVFEFIRDAGFSSRFALCVSLVIAAIVVTCFFDLALRFIESVNDEVIK